MGKIITASEKETFKLAKKIAERAKNGQIIGLIGDLGSGKTVFARGFANGLGVKQIVNSPTFVIMKVYNIKSKNSRIKKFIHIDAYRLKSGKELIQIGATDYFEQKDAVVLIEWADKIKKILPKNAKFFQFKQTTDKKREIIY